jgi:hypothetical protein
MADEANIIVALHRNKKEENCLSSFSNDKTETHRQTGLIQYPSNILIVGRNEVIKMDLTEIECEGAGLDSSGSK